MPRSVVPSGLVRVMALNRVLHAVSGASQRNVRDVGQRECAESDACHQERGQLLHNPNLHNSYPGNHFS